VQVTAKADYAVRACAELAAAVGQGPVKGDRLATAQAIPLKFLENILLELRRAGLVRSQRGAEGGYWLAKDPESISVADVLRAVDGPLADIHGTPPEEVGYAGPAASLLQVWVAARASLRTVLEHVTLADVAKANLPKVVTDLCAPREAWGRR
jgi:Rrf2 family protein